MSLRRRFLFMVLFALLVAQTMGLMHRVVHVPVFGADSSVVSMPLHEGGHSQGWADTLFVGHDWPGFATHRLAYTATSILTQTAPGKVPLPGRSLKVGLQASF